VTGARNCSSSTTGTTRRRERRYRPGASTQARRSSSELDEEAGIEQAHIVRELGRPSWPVRYENHAFEVHITGAEPADSWDHVVHGDGDDAGLVFRYRWEPVRPDLILFRRVDRMLEEL